MTREEAIKILKAIRVYECYPKSASEETKEAIDMAIESLSAKPTDLISRADALEQIAQAECGLHYEDCEADNCSCNYIWRILNIPPAESSDDFVSRQDAIERFCELGTSLERQGKTMITMIDAKYAFIKTLESLPSAESYRKDGKK